MKTGSFVSDCDELQQLVGATFKCCLDHTPPKTEKTPTGRKRGGYAGQFGPNLVATVTLLTGLGRNSQRIITTLAEVFI
jgi:hypothetical protein